MKILIAAAFVVIAATPSVAGSISDLKYFHRASGLNYLHIYGPPIVPGTTFALYDGWATNCAMHAAFYRGQDGKRYPCVP